MDYATAKQLILSYIEGWKEGDREKIQGISVMELALIAGFWLECRELLLY